MWNVAGMDDADIKLSNRTSNALERYNRTVAKIFPSPHPSLLLFVQSLQKESERVIQRVENVFKGREDPPTYRGLTFPSIPEDFYSFCPGIYGKGEEEEPEDEYEWSVGCFDGEDGSEEEDGDEEEDDDEEDDGDDESSDDDLPLGEFHRRISGGGGRVKKAPGGGRAKKAPNLRRHPNLVSRVWAARLQRRRRPARRLMLPRRPRTVVGGLGRPQLHQRGKLQRQLGLLPRRRSEEHQLGGAMMWQCDDVLGFVCTIGCAVMWLLALCCQVCVQLMPS